MRHPTAAAIASLAARLDLPNTPQMQDWAYEVADAARLPQFLALYRDGDLSEDERFVLMHTLIQCAEEADEQAAAWSAIEPLLRAEWILHKQVVSYWCCHGEPVEKAFRLTPRMRGLWESMANAARR